MLLSLMKNRYFTALTAFISVFVVLFWSSTFACALAGAPGKLHKKKMSLAQKKQGNSLEPQKAKDTGAVGDKSAAENEDADTDSGDEDKDKVKDRDKDKSKKSKDKADREEEPKLTVTHHTITIGGKVVKYKATAGYMVLKEYGSAAKTDAHADGHSKEKEGDKDKDKKKDSKPLAKVFFIAYTREDAAGVAARPLTFAFNGGPGSASVWLHMGALGPRRAVLSPRGEALPPPYRLEDNNFSWLDTSDLVFIDPVSTGFSRPEPEEDPKKFHGYTEDIESVGDFIRLYTTKNKRWSSPKFIVGESYGTTRAAGLSEFMQKRYGMYFNGIILVSTVLNFGTLDFHSGNDLPYVLYMPTYAATAWYHKRLGADMQGKSLTELLNDVEQFAAHDYLQSLFQGDRLSADKKQEMAARLSSFIGLPADYIKQLDNRVPSNLFFTHLLMDKNRQVGRFDSRYTGIRYFPGTDDFEFDPSSEAVSGAVTATFNDYVRRELKFESELPYEVSASVWPWNWKNAQNHYLDVSQDLRMAMSRNPYLKVWLCCGHYDLATPYFAAKYTVDQMALDPSLKNNVRLTYYDSGHMMYTFHPALEKLKGDFESFLKDSILPDSALVPNALP